MERDQSFYLQPITNASQSSKCWYYRAPLGINKIKTMVKDMCVKAGIIGNFTNHSLHSTGATALYQTGVPETLIKR